MEHFSEINQLKYLRRMKEVLHDNGKIYISVPIEIGFPSLIKNFRRRFANYEGNEKIYTIENILNSYLCRYSENFKTIRTGDGYLPHMGFNFQDLEKVLKSVFQLEQVFFSPFPKLPYYLNSQIFFLLRKN